MEGGNRLGRCDGKDWAVFVGHSFVTDLSRLLFVELS